MLSEISQTQKDKYCMTPLKLCTYNKQVYRDKGKTTITRAAEEEGVGGYGLMGTEFLLGMMKNFWI